jgi:acetyltransferase-like isoleucine patch superfamily enzyme
LSRNHESEPRDVHEPNPSRIPEATDVTAPRWSTVIRARIGDRCDIDSSVELVGPTTGDNDPQKIGHGATIRSGAVIYHDVVIGCNLTTGHDVLIREESTIGDDVLLGTRVVIDGQCTIGNEVSLQTGAYVPPATTIEDRVFLGPHVTLTNDPYPLRQEVELAGPTLKADVSVGANATILPDVTIGERSFVAAGAVVTKDVPAETLAVGAPATHRTLPADLQGDNR